MLLLFRRLIVILTLILPILQILLVFLAMLLLYVFTQGSSKRVDSAWGTSLFARGRYSREGDPTWK
jgi:hypothetical protein